MCVIFDRHMDLELVHTRMRKNFVPQNIHEDPSKQLATTPTEKRKGKKERQKNTNPLVPGSHNYWKGHLTIPKKGHPKNCQESIHNWPCLVRRRPFARQLVPPWKSQSLKGPVVRICFGSCFGWRRWINRPKVENPKKEIIYLPICIIRCFLREISGFCLTQIIRSSGFNTMTRWSFAEVQRVVARMAI